jgi:hypothetical protein
MLYFYAKNTDAEIFLGYFWAWATLIIFGFKYWTILEDVDRFAFTAICLITLFLSLLSIYLITNFQKIKDKYLPNHNDWAINSAIQSAGLPILISAWALFIFYNLLPAFPDFFPAILQGSPAPSNPWMTFILFPYLAFSSIRRFTQIKVKKAGDYNHGDDKAERLNFKIWQIVLAIAVSSFYYAQNSINLAFAFANTFLLSDLIFDVIYYWTNKIKQTKNIVK